MIASNSTNRTKQVRTIRQDLTDNDTHILNTGAEEVRKDAKDIEVAEVTLHQCVRQQRFDEQGYDTVLCSVVGLSNTSILNRILAFIPPDGAFELMNYRLNKVLKPVISMECTIDSHPGSRVEYLIKAKAQFKSRSTANDIVIDIPVPADCDSPQLKVCNRTIVFLMRHLYSYSIIRRVLVRSRTSQKRTPWCGRSSTCKAVKK
jgi:hypothetical protein